MSTDIAINHQPAGTRARISGAGWQGRDAVGDDGLEPPTSSV
jgi:hypothetical protein